ncbi:MAG: tail fiber domain-containing protein [Verrucomicrobiota bacterium]
MKPHYFPVFTALVISVTSALAQTTAFTYQGQLADGGVPATGSYDLLFTLRDKATTGNTLGSPFGLAAVGVTNGLFSVTVDFGTGVFTGPDRWLEIAVRTKGSSGAYTTLVPRQPVTSAPYAIRAASAPFDGVSGLPITLANNTVGSVGNNPLELSVNGQRVLRLEPTGTTPNLVGGSWSNWVSTGVAGATIAGGGATGVVFGVDGDFNRVDSDYSVIGGGLANWVLEQSKASTVAGGQRNIVGSSSYYSAIGGGTSNTVNGLQSVIAGGGHNTTAGMGTTVGGGQDNRAQYANAVISGGSSNTALGVAATISGGVQNRVTIDYASIAGGQNNEASGLHAVVAGGWTNTAEATGAAVGGGYQNRAAGVKSVVSGGYLNVAQGECATVLGGVSGVASGDYATVAGGQGSVASGANSFIAGGYDNQATAEGAFAGGWSAYATNSHSFVWSDGIGAGAASTAAYQFIIHAAGGVGIGKNNPAAALDVNGSVIASGFYPSSDKNLKENFTAISPREVLDKVTGLSVTRWNFKSDQVARHLGPMAQDFYAAFGLGMDDKHIGTVDADGVALAAIQGLNQKLEAETKTLHVEVATKNQQVNALEKRVSDLEAMVRTLTETRTK